MKDENGAIFIDRDGTYFAPLLSFLRTGELEVGVYFVNFITQTHTL